MKPAKIVRIVFILFVIAPLFFINYADISIKTNFVPYLISVSGILGLVAISLSSKISEPARVKLAKIVLVLLAAWYVVAISAYIFTDDFELPYVTLISGLLVGYALFLVITRSKKPQSEE